MGTSSWTTPVRPNLSKALFCSRFPPNFSFPLFRLLQPRASDKMEQIRTQGNCLQRWGTFLWRGPELLPRARRWQLVSLWSHVRARRAGSCYTFTNLCHSGALPLHPPHFAPSLLSSALVFFFFFNPPPFLLFCFFFIFSFLFLLFAGGINIFSQAGIKPWTLLAAALPVLPLLHVYKFSRGSRS